MKEKYTWQSKDTLSSSNQIENIFVSEEYENEKVFLILENRGEVAESICIFYQESDRLGSKTLDNLKIPGYSQQKVQLPKGFEKWNKLCFRVRGKERSISDVSLKKLSDEVKRQIKVEPSQPEAEPSISKPEQTDGSEDLTDKAQKPRIETTHLPDLSSIDYRREAATIVQQTNERVNELARAYKDGGAIDFVNIENPTPSQNVLLILNWIVGTIMEWKSELEQSGKTDRNLIDILTYREQDIKEKLKAIRGERTPLPDPLELETDIYTDAELNEIRRKCSYYVVWFEGRLFGYEERAEINNLEEYDQFIPQFIRDRFFNSVSRFVPFDQLPERLERCLQLVGYEIVPIEIGKTQADARVHDIQGSRQTDNENGTVVEVILPGLRRIADGEIVQKPVVIRGE